MTKKQRYEAILNYFRKEMPEVQTELEFGTAPPTHNANI